MESIQKVWLRCVGGGAVLKLMHLATFTNWDSVESNWQPQNRIERRQRLF